MPGKRKRPMVATRSELLRVRRELIQVRTLATATAMALDVTRRECEASIRRCGELQNEIDTLKKLFQPA